MHFFLEKKFVGNLKVSSSLTIPNISVVTLKVSSLTIPNISGQLEFLRI